MVSQPRNRFVAFVRVSGRGEAKLREYEHIYWRSGSQVSQMCQVVNQVVSQIMKHLLNHVVSQVRRQVVIQFAQFIKVIQIILFFQFIQFIQSVKFIQVIKSIQSIHFIKLIQVIELIQVIKFIQFFQILNFFTRHLRNRLCQHARTGEGQTHKKREMEIQTHAEKTTTTDVSTHRLNRSYSCRF